MPTITRAAVVGIVRASLGQLGRDLSDRPDGTFPEGDYSFGIDEALRDIGLDAITGATTHGMIRAVVRGTEFYVLRRLYRDRAAQVTVQTGAGGVGTLSLEWGQALGSLRLHVESAQKNYEEALTAIGRSLSFDPQHQGIAQTVQLDVEDTDDETVAAIMDPDTGLPWYQDGVA